jgi:hypothetical protein
MQLAPRLWSYSVKVGDLVIYEAEYRTSDVPEDNTYNVPGIVVDIDLDDEDDRILVVQWLDWKPGQFANEDPEILEIFSEAR